MDIKMSPNNEDEKNPIFSSLPNLILAIFTSGVLAIGSLFFQNQITASKSETRITYLENSIEEVKVDNKETRRVFEAQLQGIDVRLREVEQRR